MTEKIYWYRARLYLNGHFCDCVFLKSDSADYSAGKMIERHFANGFLFTLIVSYSYGPEKPRALIEPERTAFPLIISEV